MVADALSRCSYAANLCVVREWRLMDAVTDAVIRVPETQSELQLLSYP